MLKKICLEICSQIRKNFSEFLLLISKPKHKIFDDFWDEFEAGCASAGLISKVPLCMKKLLTISGYNSTWSFKSLTEGKLPDIEEYIEKRHRKIADQFDEYKDIRPFEFLPGHRALILGIKSEIIDIQETKKPKKQIKEKSVLSELDL